MLLWRSSGVEEARTAVSLTTERHLCGAPVRLTCPALVSICVIGCLSVCLSWPCVHTRVLQLPLFIDCTLQSVDSRHLRLGALTVSHDKSNDKLYYGLVPQSVCKHPNQTNLEHVYISYEVTLQIIYICISEVDGIFALA